MSRMPRERQCGYPGCFRTEMSAIHQPALGCKRCRYEGGHVYWNAYLSVNQYKARLNEHHFWISPSVGWKVDFSSKVLELPPLEGITFD